MRKKTKKKLNKLYDIHCSTWGDYGLVIGEIKKIKKKEKIWRRNNNLKEPIENDCAV